MARWRDLPPPPLDVRALLIERERTKNRPPISEVDPVLAERHRWKGVGQGPRAPTRLELLLAGESVVIYGWEIIRSLPRPWPFDPHDMIRLERDGRLTVVESIPDPADPLSSIGWKERHGSSPPNSGGHPATEGDRHG
jgi:hypothetical protein